MSRSDRRIRRPVHEGAFNAQSGQTVQISHRLIVAVFLSYFHQPFGQRHSP